MQFKSTLCFKCWFTNLWSTAVTFLSFFAYAVSTVTVDSLKLEQSRHVTNLNSYRYWRVFMGRCHWRLTVFYVITPTLCRRLEFYIRCCSYRIANLHRGSKVQVQEQEIVKCLIFRIETVTVIWRHFVAPLAFPSSLVCDAPINLCELLLLGGANSISNLKYIQGELVWGYLRLESSGLPFWLILNLEKLFSANLSIMEEKS